MISAPRSGTAGRRASLPLGAARRARCTGATAVGSSARRALHSRKIRVLYNTLRRSAPAFGYYKPLSARPAPPPALRGYKTKNFAQLRERRASPEVRQMAAIVAYFEQTVVRMRKEGAPPAGGGGAAPQRRRATRRPCTADDRRARPAAPDQTKRSFCTPFQGACSGGRGRHCTKCAFCRSAECGRPVCA